MVYSMRSGLLSPEEKWYFIALKCSRGYAAAFVCLLHGAVLKCTALHCTMQESAKDFNRADVMSCLNSVPVTSVHIMSCLISAHHVMSHHRTSCHVIPLHIISCHTIAHHVMSHHCTSCQVKSCQSFDIALSSMAMAVSICLSVLWTLSISLGKM